MSNQNRKTFMSKLYIWSKLILSGDLLNDKYCISEEAANSIKQMFVESSKKEALSSNSERLAALLKSNCEGMLKNQNILIKKKELFVGNYQLCVEPGISFTEFLNA